MLDFFGISVPTVRVALLVAASVFLCYRYAEAPVARLGETGRTVVMRLSAILLLCIGVQIAWNGIRALLIEALK